MHSRITQLIRSNIALAFLCIIAGGVLIMTIRGQEGVKMDKPVQEAPRIVPVDVRGGSTSDRGERALLSASLRDAPLPSSLLHITFSGQATTSVSLLCEDAYSVLLMYPVDVEYRINPLGSVYNRAFPCLRQATTTQVVDLHGLPLRMDMVYYFVRAHQGAEGSWYGPY